MPSPGVSMSLLRGELDPVVVRTVLKIVELQLGVMIIGVPWENPNQPLMLDASAVPVKIVRKQARGTVTLLPAEDFARLELDDHHDGSDSYRIEFGTK